MLKIFLEIFVNYLFYSHLGVARFENIFEIFFNSQLGVAGVGAVAGADTAMLLVRSYVSQSHTELLKLKH